MNKKMYQVVLLGSALFSCSAFAMESLGDGVPGPFDDLNRRVELADQEAYTLVGRVVYSNGQPLFAPDYKAHSWLKNVQREKGELYTLVPFKNARYRWSHYVGAKVQIYVQAKSRVIWKQGEGFKQHILLEPISNPDVLP